MKRFLEKAVTLYTNLSLKKKLMIIFTISLSVISAAGFLGLRNISKAHLKLLEESVSHNLSYCAVTISDYLHYIEDMTGIILADSSIQENLIINNTGNDREQAVSYQTLSYSIEQYYEQCKSFYVDYITLYTPKNTIYSNFLGNRRTPEEIETCLLDLSNAGEGRPAWVFDYAEENGFYLVRLIRNSHSPYFSALGTLIVSVNLDQMLQALNQREGALSDAQYFISRNGEIIYHADDITHAIRKETTALSSGHYEILSVGGHKYFVYSTRIPDWDLTYTCYIAYDSIFHSASIAWFTSIFIIILTGAAVIIFSQSMISFISRHTQLLVERMQAYNARDNILPENDYDYSHRKDEFGLLNRQFDHMASRIQNLIQDNYVNELWKKEAQLKALEKQVDPHFLYNTLESINWRAKAAGNGDISQMVESLGNLLRASLSKDTGKWTLEKEFAILSSYIIIQKYRFENHLDYISHCEEKLLMAHIPKFIIQPLVENAIHYGLEECMEICHVEVNIFLEETEENLHILVKNNGSLFEDNLLQKLYSHQIQSRGSGIGLININERIKLMFGSDYGLQLYNEDDKAVAQIDIPYLVI